MRVRNSAPRGRLVAFVFLLACSGHLGAADGELEKAKREEEEAREKRQGRFEETMDRLYGRHLPGLLDRATRTRIREHQAFTQEMRRRKELGLNTTEPAWTFLGPSVRTHRTLPSDDSGLAADMAVSPTDPKTLFVASGGGGVWRSTDGGSTWKLVTADIPVLQFGAVAVAPSDAQRVYAGAGCADNSTFALGNARSTGYPLKVGFGMIRSTDGGETWTQLPRENRPADFFWQILVDPQNPDILLVAGDRGVQRSTDGGTTWTAVLRSDSAPWAPKLSRPAGDSSVVFAATWGPVVQGVRTPGSIYKSTDGGVTWAEKTTGLPGDAETRGRISVAVAPSDPARVYAHH